MIMSSSFLHSKCLKNASKILQIGSQKKQGKSLISQIKLEFRFYAANNYQITRNAKLRSKILIEVTKFVRQV